MVPAASTTMPHIASRAGPFVDSRLGHSAKRTKAGPTTRIRPAKPRQRELAMATETVVEVFTGSDVSEVGVSVCLPTEYAKPPLIGWLSAEITR
jgi:hypothetical protein